MLSLGHGNVDEGRLAAQLPPLFLAAASTPDTASGPGGTFGGAFGAPGSTNSSLAGGGALTFIVGGDFTACSFNFFAMFVQE